MNVDEIRLYSASEVGVSAELFASLSVSSVGPTQPYILESAVGLDPDQIYPVFSGAYFSGSTKEKYYDMTVAGREIKLKIKLNPQLGISTYSSLRDGLYKIISKSRTSQVELRFMYNNSAVATIVGIVNKVESNLFDLDPKITFSIFCQDGMFKGPSYINAVPDITYSQPMRFEYTDTVSNAPHGFQMKLTCVYDVEYLIIESEVSNGANKHIFRINKTLVQDDELFFSSEDGNRYLFFERTNNGVTDRTHITDKIEAGAVWPMIFPGENTYFLNSERSPGQPEIYGTDFYVTTLVHKAHYWGL